MKFFGQLESVSLENLSVDPGPAVSGRIYFNTATQKAMLDDGTVKRALLRNDNQPVFGTDTTASNNVRLHHSGVGILQFVPGNDTTAENTPSTSLAQVGLRSVNVSTTPAVGNIGRLVYNTATQGLMVDNGTQFLQFATLTGAETLSNKTLTAPVTDVIAHTDQTATPTTPASGSTKIYTRTGSLYKLGSDGVETLLAAATGVTNTVTKTTSYTASANDGYAFLNGAFTVTLPPATSVAGVRFYFQKIDAPIGQTLIVDSSSNLVITLWTQGETAVVMASGGQWYVVDRSIPNKWTAFTQTISAVTTAPVKPTTRGEFARWKRDGGDIVMEWGMSWTNNTGATAGSGTYLFGPPTGTPQFDFNQKPQGTPAYQWLVGDARLSNASQSALGQCMIYNSTQFYIQGKNSQVGGSTSVNDATYGSAYFSLNDATYPVTHQFRVRLPIQGWNV